MTENNIIVFTDDMFGLFGNVRSLMIDDEPWFVGKDVAGALGYSNSRKAIADHVDGEDKTDGVTIRDAIGREQNPVLINESGLYSLIFSSKLSDAKKFKHWVTAVVLPTLRKTGSYTLPGVEKNQRQSNLTPDDIAAIASIVSMAVVTAIREDRDKRKVNANGQLFRGTQFNTSYSDPYARIRVGGEYSPDDLSFGLWLGYRPATHRPDAGRRHVCLPSPLPAVDSGNWKRGARGRVKMLTGFLYSSSSGKYATKTMSYEKFEYATLTFLYRRMELAYGINLNEFKACGSFGGQRKCTGTLQVVADNDILRQYFDEVVDWYLSRCNEYSEGDELGYGAGTLLELFEAEIEAEVNA